MTGVILRQIAHKMLHIQKFLHDSTTFNGGDIDAALQHLKDHYFIDIKQSTRFPHLYLFKYNQIESPMAEPLVQECRGLILDALHNWAVVSMPYTKFWNYGESLAAPIHWESATVWEKLDGSLITLYFYGGSWHISTSGTPDANCQVGDSNWTFEDLFIEAASHTGMSWAELDPNYCYMFELCTPYNRVVVQHGKSRVYLHGARNITTLQEEWPERFAEALKVPTPRRYELGDAESCLAAAKKLQPLENEGYVVCDARFNRIKIKSPAYIALHHAKDSMLSRRRMALIIRDGETSEFELALSSFPELANDFYEIRDNYEALVTGAEMAYDALKNIEDQKEFALAAKQTGVESILFAMRKRSCSPQTFLKSLHEPAYLRIIGVK